MLATGNAARVRMSGSLRASLAGLPQALRGRVVLADDCDAGDCSAVLFEGDGDALREVARKVAELGGPIRPVFGTTADALLSGTEDYPLDLLLAERPTSTNTAAAGGNAGLMTIG